MVNDSVIRDVVTLHNPGSVVDPDRTLERDGSSVTPERNKPPWTRASKGATTCCWLKRNACPDVETASWVDLRSLNLSNSQETMW